MSMPNLPTANAAWEVLTTTPGVGPNVIGRNVPGHLVTARLIANGATFQVFVPDEDVPYVDKVKADIQAKANAIMAINGLRG